jgi:uncharacterized membrane protein
VRKIGWAVMASLAALIATYGVALLALPAMRPAFIRDRFVTLPVAVFLHLLASPVALAIGPFQLNSRMRSRSLRRHRYLGRVYMVCVALGGAAGLALAPVSQGGLPAHTGFVFLAVLWLATTGTAYRRIRFGDVTGHQTWMIRSYALTFAAVTLRIYLPVSHAAGIPFEPAYQAVSWLCWVPNLVLAEWLLRRQPPKPHATTAVVATV